MPEALEGADDLAKRLRALSEKTPRILLEAWQADTVARAKDNISPFSKTRTLSRSIRAGDLDVRSGGATVLAGGINKVGYARFVEEGTGIYGPKGRPIVPVRAKALRFPARGAATRLSGNLTSAQQRAGGGWAFAKSVKGRRATPYLRPAAVDAMRALNLTPVVRVAWDDAS